MEYRAVVDRTVDDFYNYQQLHKKAKHHALYVTFRVVMAVFLAVIVLMGIVLTLIDSWDAELIVSYAVFCALFVLWVFIDRIVAWLSARMQLKTGSLDTTFAEDEISVVTDKLKEQYPYSSVIEAYHYKKTYFLYVDKRHAMLLPERCFTEGDVSLFGEFISEKCKVTVKEVK